MSPSPARIRSTLAAAVDQPDDLRELRRVHKVLADVNRLRLCRVLAEGPATVTELVDRVALSQPLVSWHLSKLREVGLVSARRNGRETIHTLERRPSRCSPPGRHGPSGSQPAAGNGGGGIVSGSFVSTTAGEGPRPRRARRAALRPLGLSPNVITVIGFGIAVVAAVVAGLQAWLPAGLLIIFGGIFDMFDGMVARATNWTSRPAPSWTPPSTGGARASSTSASRPGASSPATTSA